MPLDPEIFYISHALLVKMFDWGFQFLEWAFVFFPLSRVPFREKKDVNNELTKGGLMGACVARCLHYVTCLHHALKACIQTLNFSHEPIRFCSIRSSTYTISEFWRVNSSSVRKFISNWRESAVFDFPQCADCS